MSEVKAVIGFEPVAVLLRNVLDQDVETGGDSHALFEITGVEFVGERYEIAETELWFLAEF